MLKSCFAPQHAIGNVSLHHPGFARLDAFLIGTEPTAKTLLKNRRPQNFTACAALCFVVTVDFCRHGSTYLRAVIARNFEARQRI